MYTQQLPRTSKPVTAGRIVDVDEAYARPIPIPWSIVITVVVLAAMGRLPIMILAALRGATVPGGSDRALKTLHAGPEIPVMPLWVRDEDNQVIELEVHGYVRSDRLMIGDRVRVDLRAQRRGGRPPRAHRLYNLTTGQTVRPHPNTMWGHLGLALLIQAAFGILVTALLVTAWFVGG